MKVDESAKIKEPSIKAENNRWKLMDNQYKSKTHRLKSEIIDGSLWIISKNQGKIDKS